MRLGGIGTVSKIILDSVPSGCGLVVLMTSFSHFGTDIYMSVPFLF